MLVLGIASFVIAATGVVVGVLSFMKINNDALRYALGSACLLLTFLFSIVGLYAFFNVINSSTSSEIGNQAVTVVQPEQQTSSQPSQSEVEILPSSSKVHLEEVQKTGAETRIVYEFELASDEVIAGDSYDFQDVGLPCNAFLIQGPGHIDVAILDGGWYRYSGVTTQEKAEELLQKQVKYLEGHSFCKDIDIRVIRLNAGE